MNNVPFATPGGPSGPKTAERRIFCAAEQVQADLDAQRRKWDRGFTRRRFLAGSGMVATAALGSQLVTARHAYAELASGNGKTLVVVFLRGGLDGLTALVPRNDPNLYGVRGSIGIPDGALIPLDSTFGLHPALRDVHPLWLSGQLGFVHAVGSPDANRDHFAAQLLAERGTTVTSTPTGWLDRVLEMDGPGTTFRAVTEAPTVARALVASTDTIAMMGIDSLTFNNPSAKISTALRQLFTGLDNPLEDLMSTTLSAVTAAVPIRATPPGPAPGAQYSVDDFGKAMADIARLVKASCGLRVATVDLGGWDVHTDAGTATAGAMQGHLAGLAKNLGAFATDLGSRLADVSVVVMSEFGRRVAQNGGGGTDHGHGGLMMLLGGGIRGGQVHGSWPGLAPADLFEDDLRIVNDSRDVLGEVAQKTLNLGSLTNVFLGYPVSALGVMR